MVAVSEVIDQKPDRTAVVRDDDVCVAVVIDVAERSTAADFGQREHPARLAGDVLEAAVAEVSKQLLPLIVRKPAVRPPFQRHFPVDREDVEQAVVVEIKPGGPEPGVRQARGSNPGLRADVLKLPGPVIHEQIVPLACEIREEQVFVAIVVEIAGIDAHARFWFAELVDRRA